MPRRNPTQRLGGAFTGRHRPGRATTATSTGGTAGGRCWRGLGGREQPSRRNTLGGYFGYLNHLSAYCAMWALPVPGTGTNQVRRARRRGSSSSMATRSCSIESRSRTVTARSSSVDRKSVVEGKRVSVRGDLGGRGIVKNKKKHKKYK